MNISASQNLRSRFPIFRHPFSVLLSVGWNFRSRRASPFLQQEVPPSPARIEMSAACRDMRHVFQRYETKPITETERPFEKRFPPSRARISADNSNALPTRILMRNRVSTLRKQTSDRIVCTLAFAMTIATIFVNSLTEKDSESREKFAENLPVSVLKA